MDKPAKKIPTIKIDTAKLKPIRCTGKTIRYMHSLDKTQKETICQGTVIGMIAGQVMFVSSEASDGGIYVSGLLNPSTKRTLTDVAKRVSTEFVIDGKSRLVNCELIGGRSLTVFCRNCGTARKMFGVNIIVDVTEEKLDTVRF